MHGMCFKCLEIAREQSTLKKVCFLTLVLLCQACTFTENHTGAQIHPQWATGDTQWLFNDRAQRGRDHLDYWVQSFWLSQKIVYNLINKFNQQVSSALQKFLSFPLLVRCWKQNHFLWLFRWAKTLCTVGVPWPAVNKLLFLALFSMMVIPAEVKDTGALSCCKE